MATSPASTRKRVKKILKQLWELQKHDIPMTAATLLEVKYLLRSTNRCVRVDIESDKLRDALYGCLFDIEYDAIPEFILCQLEDQKLTVSRSQQVALPAALSSIGLFLSTGPSQRNSFPTQFRWQCALTHRTLIIFAFVDIKMKSRMYSIPELLNLRGSHSSDGLAVIAQRDSELAELIRRRARISGTCHNTLKRGSHKTKDDSSTESEEILFKGNMSRRSIPIKPEPEPIVAAKDHIPEGADTEWKYRGRSGSEVTSIEPLSAPTGINAQQNEGFQRFYKAVVSPTHVRVTAGGRIVPNTRGPSSPTSKRDKDSETTTNGQAEQPSEPKAAPTAKQPVPVMGMPHPMPFYYPGFHPGMPPVHPVTGMPMSMMPPGFPFPHMPMPNPASMEAQERARKENYSKQAEGGEPAQASSDQGKTGPNVRISPPEQFDHTKPFMYNGQQWMGYPMPGMYPGPFPGFLRMPPPGYPGPHMPGPMIMPPHMMPPMMGPMGFQPGPPPPAVSAQPTPVVTRHNTPQPPSKPPISSIRPSDISKKQIEGLRANLKYHEDQLQYNKHQIDEKDMESKIKLLQNDIDRFERVLASQLDFEGKHYPKVDKVKDEGASSSSRSSAPSTKTSQSQSEESKESKLTTDTQTSVKSRKKERSRDTVGLNSSRSNNASYNFDDLRATGAIDPIKKSGLPSGAALAPPFQPRSVSAYSFAGSDAQGAPPGWQNANGAEQVTQEQLDASEKRLLAAGSKAWNIGTEPRPSDFSNQRQFQDPLSQGGQENLGVPYLVGTLPRGINPYAAHRVDYEYHRHLTDEEVQARHLYWGKAPRSVSHGLPKYDGKNFYPPSPVKNSILGDSPSIRRRRIPIGVPEVDYAFQAPDGKDPDPFRSMPPRDAYLTAQDLTTVSKAPSERSVRSFNSQPDNSEEFEKALEESKSAEEPVNFAVPTRNANKSDTKSADFHDTRSNGTSGKLWQSMLKRGLTSSDVLPSAVSSTIAHGYLPQFNGHAAASLNPTISGSIGSPSRGTPSRTNEYDAICGSGISSPSFIAEKRGENCPPPPGNRSLSETLRNIVGVKPPGWTE